MRPEPGAMLESPDAHASISSQRRHDVDWLRTLAMGLLIIFHIVLSFQPWAALIGFPQERAASRRSRDLHVLDQYLAHPDSIPDLGYGVSGSPWNAETGRNC